MTAKELRLAVFAKYGGRCAYCGKALRMDRTFHVDHRDPVYHTHRARNSYTIEELEPACARCNGWKLTLSVDMFRREIEAQLDRVRNKCPGLRLAEDMGAVQVTSVPVRFLFETFTAPAPDGEQGK